MDGAPTSHDPFELTRRRILQASALAGGAFIAAADRTAIAATATGAPATASSSPSEPGALPDLRPARWIWYPSGRTLPNTFVLFRRALTLTSAVKRATGWVSADSRYLLTVNGQRVQWGPSPCDPRWLEADPIDLTSMLQAGRNVIGATVLYYGHGDGTWTMGKPGFLLRLDIELEGGKKLQVVSGASWQAHLARAWRSGQYKRWYLRALQEEFDARRYPHGWSNPDFKPDENWLPAMMLDAPPDKPAACSSYPEYAHEIQGDRSVSQLRARSTPLMLETEVEVGSFHPGFWLEWRRPAEEYFEIVTPDSFRVTGTFEHAPAGGNAVWFEAIEGRTAVLTIELARQVVGWPHFAIEAPAGTIVELLVQEAHDPIKGPPLLNTHFHAWSRFTCREGYNRFEPFEYESCRWLQFVIRNAHGKVTVSEIGVRQRVFPWSDRLEVTIDESPLQLLMEASVNTLDNCAQETLVDGMGRERQQYSGDCGHQLHAIYLGYGEHRLPARYLNTFSQGQTLDGYFLDCYPAHDRLARLAQRQLQMTGWGPLLDHGVGFNFDCWHHYLYTGRIEDLREVYPRLLKFARYLRSIVRDDGLLPVEAIGVPSVWIDHQGFHHQRHKRCAFNLYAAAAMEYALAPLCRARGEESVAREHVAFGRALHAACVKAFWSQQEGAFVDNLPWLGEERAPRFHDRTLATAVLFDQCPDQKTRRAVELLAEAPKEMGFSYPANAGWRLWALGKAGRADVIVRDLRERWATLDSVVLNHTLQEDWKALPDSGSQWSHCAVAPLYVLYMSIAGIRPTEPGFKRYEIRPQLADLGDVSLAAHTPRGMIRFEAKGDADERSLKLQLPPDIQGTLILPGREACSLPAAPCSTAGCKAYALPQGETVRLKLAAG